jgi:hypothetical protein
MSMHEHDLAYANGSRKRRRSKGESSMDFDAIKNWIKRLLP